MNRAFFSTERAKKRIYASNYPTSERMKFACAANVYASGTVHRVVRPLSSPSIEPSDWIVVAVTVPTRTNPRFTCKHQGKHEQTQNREKATLFMDPEAQRRDPIRRHIPI